MQQKKGFTLIELLVVIAIIGILSAIGLVSLNGAREKARDSKKKSDLATLSTALQLYYDDQATPSFPSQGTASWVKEGVLSAATFTPTYINVIPNSPTDAATADAKSYWYITNSVALTVAGKSYAIDNVFGLATKLEGGAANWYGLNNLGFGGEIFTAASGTSSGMAFAVTAGAPDTTTDIDCKATGDVGDLDLCKTTAVAL